MARTLDLGEGRAGDAEAMCRLGRHVAGQIAAGDALALVGDLGAGKTTFVQGLADGLGVDPEAVTSPTFALVHHYRGGDIPIVHADLYRLGSAAEAEEAGIADALHDPEAVAVVEWPLVAAGVVPRHAIWLQFTVDGEARQVAQVLPPARGGAG